MPTTLNLAHINIEGSKHLNRVTPFLRERRPDVACLEELKEPDIGKFENELGMKCFYVPMVIVDGGIVIGMGIFSRLPFKTTASYYYGGHAGRELGFFDPRDKETLHDSVRYSLAVCEIEKEGETFRIGTTHFPVTDQGVATDFQRKDMRALLAILEKQGEIVFSGDFNAPRGREIFAMLAAVYADNIPREIVTSLDYSIHRAGKNLIASAQALGLEGLMVDGIFSTPGYKVSNTEMHSGISDHCGFTASVTKR